MKELFRKKQAAIFIKYKDFMFRLTDTELENMRSQIVTASESQVVLGSQIVTTYQSRRNKSVIPYAFTEQDVAMLSSVLNTKEL